MPAPIDATGKVYGRLTVLSKSEPIISANGRPRTKWLCLCQCGIQTNVDIAKLQSGHTQSCGCFHKDQINKPRTHGLRTGAGKQSKEYQTWAGMRQRCNNPNDAKYPLYGGRGISICARWSQYPNFLKDMGEAPAKEYSIDRIDTNGNYEPSNCRWATAKQQANNLRTTRFLEAAGIRDTLAGWCERLGVERHMIENGLRRGKTFQQLYDRFSPNATR